MCSRANERPGCGNPGVLPTSERGIEHLWAQFKRRGSYEEWKLITDMTFHD